ncbi:MAG: polyprenyl synthetase family protein [Azoarcus sp.]|jgi:farnesyl diphosphate synthase|nr:polyprenyl synthetase family protein [Azoarcus sp.]
MNFPDWVTYIQQRTETALQTILPAASLAPCRLHEAMRYAALGGGKRIRSLLVHATGSSFTHAKPEQLDRAACAVELIHAYSLIHDDLPCMDDDKLRRGKPTVHVEYDEATALLAGDALQTLAFQVLAETSVSATAAGQIEAILLLAQAAGSHGMAGGQAIDIASAGHEITREVLESMHVRKTGALVRAAVLIGARAGEGVLDNRRQRLDHYAKRIGLLYQVVDDILDAASDTATLGKTAGKDASNGKPTYVSLLGLTDARRFAEDLLSEAHEALAPLGERASRLHELADFISHRAF